MKWFLTFCCGVSLAAPVSAAVSWREVMRQHVGWFASPEAARIADSVVLYQTVHGGWPKNVDMTAPPDAELQAKLRDPTSRDTTIDNGATHTQLKFLARVISAGGETRCRPAFDRGVDYLLSAQYPHGGWPQYYPLRQGYYTHITFNDDAMIGVMELLRDIALGSEPYQFVDPARRARSAQAVNRGVACILKTQVVVHGKKTVWCAQHDEKTLAPAPARKFEPVSLSGGESVGIVRFLMDISSPDPEIIGAITAAVAWFELTKITGIRVDTVAAPALPRGRDRVVVADPSAPPLWARFYEIGTNRPIFAGRDAVVKYSLAEIEHERRISYAWYRDTPRKLLERDYPQWAARWLKPDA